MRFDAKLNQHPLPPWIESALASTLSAVNFPQSLGQTIGVNDPHWAGGARYALALAHALLCDMPQINGLQQGRACGLCSQCLLLKVGNHSDLMTLVPEILQADFVPEKDKKASKTVKVEQLRALESGFNLSSQRGGRKVVIIYPAHTLGVVPANALLKTLEEPPPNTFFIVVSEQWEQVLPTLRSRCVVQSITQPTTVEKTAWLEAQSVPHPKRWLELASARVDKALAMAQDPLWMPQLKLMPYLLQGANTDAIGLGNEMSKAELKRVIESLALWTHDVLALAVGAPARFFAAHTASMQTMVSMLDLERAAQFAAHLAKMAVLAEHPLSARTQCEALLLEYKALFK